MRRAGLFVLGLTFLGLAFAAPAIAVRPLTANAVACGVERWPVKTLSDADAGAVNFAPVPATVAQLRALAAPGSSRSVVSTPRMEDSSSGCTRGNADPS